VTVQAFRKAVHLAETKSGAAADPFRCEERIEGFRPHFLWHAGSVILHDHLDIPARFRASRPLRFDANVLSPDGDAAAVGHGVTRIDNEIEDGGFQLHLVGQNRIRAGRKLAHDPDPRPDGALKQIFQFREDTVGIYRHGFRSLAAQPLA
jgi:hypothetical protein